MRDLRRSTFRDGDGDEGRKGEEIDKTVYICK